MDRHDYVRRLLEEKESLSGEKNTLIAQRDETKRERDFYASRTKEVVMKFDEKISDEDVAITFNTCSNAFEVGCYADFCGTSFELRGLSDPANKVSDKDIEKLHEENFKIKNRNTELQKEIDDLQFEINDLKSRDFVQFLADKIGEKFE